MAVRARDLRVSRSRRGQRLFSEPIRTATVRNRLALVWQTADAVLRRSERRGIQNLKAYVTKTTGQCALLPADGKPMLQLPPFAGGEVFEFYLRHHGATPLVAHIIEFHVGLPITSRYRVLRPAEILKHGCSVIVDQLLPFRPAIGGPARPMRRIDLKPEAQRRVLNAIPCLFGGAQAFAKRNLTRQHGGIQQLLERAAKIRLGRAQTRGNLRGFLRAAALGLFFAGGRLNPSRVWKPETSSRVMGSTDGDPQAKSPGGR